MLLFLAFTRILNSLSLAGLELEFLRAWLVETIGGENSNLIGKACEGVAGRTAEWKLPEFCCRNIGESEVKIGEEYGGLDSTCSYPGSDSGVEVVVEVVAE